MTQAGSDVEVVVTEPVPFFLDAFKGFACGPQSCGSSAG